MSDAFFSVRPFRYLSPAAALCARAARFVNPMILRLCVRRRGRRCCCARDGTRDAERDRNLATSCRGAGNYQSNYTRAAHELLFAPAPALLIIHTARRTYVHSRAPHVSIASLQVRPARTDAAEQSLDSSKQPAEGRRQKTEVRRQKTEDRRRKTEDRLGGDNCETIRICNMIGA